MRAYHPCVLVILTWVFCQNDKNDFAILRPCLDTEFWPERLASP